MGYDAHSVDVNFTIPAADTDAALAAVNALTGCTYASLSDAIHEETFSRTAPRTPSTALASGSTRRGGRCLQRRSSRQWHRSRTPARMHDFRAVTTPIRLPCRRRMPAGRGRSF